MSCRNCNSERIMSVSGKCSDMFNGRSENVEFEGYVPDCLPIGGGDYMEFDFCLNCGTIQSNKFPLSDEDLKGDEEE